MAKFGRRGYKTGMTGTLRPIGRPDTRRASPKAKRRFGALRQMRSGASVALLVGMTLIQCYATRTKDDCTPMSVHATMTECRALASEYRKFDTRALRVTGLPVMVSCQCVAVK